LKVMKSLSTIIAFLSSATLAHGHGKDAVFIFNTYQNQGFTGGSEAVYEEANATISDKVEFELFPKFFGGTPEGGFYNIDFVASDDNTGGTCTFTLKDSTGASNKVYLNGEYDRYYIAFTKSIKSVKLGETSNYNAEVSTYTYKDVPAADTFNYNLTFPDYISNNVFLLEFKAGSDLNELEQTIVVTYEFGEVEDTTTRSSSEVSVYNTFQGLFSGYAEIFYEEKTVNITNETEFTAFPFHVGSTEYGFYDINVELDSFNPNKIEVTFVVNNSTGASEFDNYTFDRYYLTFDKPLESVEVTRFDSFAITTYIPANKTAAGKSFSSNTVVLEIGPGTNLTATASPTIVFEVMIQPIEFEVASGEVTAFNAYRNSNRTGSTTMVVYYKETATIGDGVEFELFPPNPPGKPAGGFYNIDIAQGDDGGTIVYTLKDNNGATNKIFQPGEYDKYYFFFNETIDSVKVTDTGNFNIKTYVPEYMEVSTIDLFGTGLEFPSVLGNNVIAVDVQVNSDLNTIDSTFSLEYTLKKKGRSGRGRGDMDIDIYNTYQGAFVAYGEFGFEAKTATLSDGNEFELFPVNPNNASSGFYNINITLDEDDKLEGFAEIVNAFAEGKYLDGYDKDGFGLRMDRNGKKSMEGTISFTLMDNTGASHIVTQPSEFDRYYITFDKEIEAATLVSSGNLQVDVSVKKYQDMTGLIVDSAPGAPEFYDEKTIVVEIAEGSNLTVEGQVIEIEFSIAGGNRGGILSTIFNFIFAPFIFLFGLCF